jgi:hypothetical protein
MIHADDPQVAIEMYETDEEAFKQVGPRAESRLRLHWGRTCCIDPSRVFFLATTLSRIGDVCAPYPPHHGDA